MKMRSRRSCANRGRASNSPGVITLYYQRIAAERFAELSAEEKYCMLILGHVHDEVSWLQRMSYIASKSEGRCDVEQAANLMQTTFLARLLLGKLFEFKKLLSVEGSPIPGFIAEHFEPTDRAVGARQVDDLHGYYMREKWIRVARNKHFLHYPEMADVATTINDPAIEWEIEIAHGKKASNTFYRTSDVLANYAWFRLANPNAPMEGFGEALDTIRELAGLTLHTLAQAIGYFVDRKLQPLSTNEVVRIRARQSIYEARLDYFLKT